MTPPSALQRVQSSFAAQGLMQTLGARLLHATEGEVQIVLPFSPALSQQRGFVHAGAITSVVDSACGYAALTVAPPDCEVVTIEFKVNFLRPAIGQEFLATGRVQSAGRQVTVCTGEVTAVADGMRKVVALMQATIMNVRHEA
ncbi:MAG TPA: PaaI family thioesterase [Usitatibacteraceae bacterium]|nr:PaaI family thioesterase [Usitatibacteraceae bacterium]